MSQTIVIKIGGVASQQLPQDFLDQLKNWISLGHRLVIVHGGGFAINKSMKDKAIPVKKIKGLRVTQQSDMPLVHQVLIEQVGQDISKKLLQTGIDSLQIQSSLPKIVEADFLDKELLGYVGQVKRIKASILHSILDDGMIPVVAPLGYTNSGEELNINADYLATAIASSLAADRLILMTDVPGVLENQQVMSRLRVGDVKAKIEGGIISGGMIPKIESAVNTVMAGVGQVIIGDTLNRGTVIEA